MSESVKSASCYFLISFFFFSFSFSLSLLVFSFCLFIQYSANRKNLLFLYSNYKMTLPFFQKTGVKKKKPVINESSSTTYPTLSSLIQKTGSSNSSESPSPPSSAMDPLEPEEIDENFFYKHMMTHFHSLFCESAIVCIPHSKSIEGLVITKDIIGNLWWCGMKRFVYWYSSTCSSLLSSLDCNPSRISLFSNIPLLLWTIHGNETKAENHCARFSHHHNHLGWVLDWITAREILSLPIIGFKEERTVHIMAEESVYLKNKKIKLLSIDRLLEGEPPVSNMDPHTHTHIYIYICVCVCVDPCYLQVALLRVIDLWIVVWSFCSLDRLILLPWYVQCVLL